MSNQENTNTEVPVPLSTDDLQTKLNIRFHDESLLVQAMTHRSFANENGNQEPDNERLEFLGDAVLNFLSGDMLYNLYPDSAEGRLTRLRAALVRTESLRELALHCELDRALRMGKGEESSGGRRRKTNLCAAFEALVGALYLDQGIDAVRDLVLPMLEARLDVVIDEALYQDARTLLQEWSQSEYGITPVYDTVSETGPDHDKEYKVAVVIDESVAGEGVGRSKRAAAQSAARDALKSIQIEARENEMEAQRTGARLATHPSSDK